VLKVRHCSKPEQKVEIFAEADPQRDSWVVSDLQSKWHVQRRWLDQTGALEQIAVVRATELWRQFAFQLKPDLQLVSPELAQTLIWNWLEPRQLPWARTPQSVAVVQKQMQMWVSVFAHPEYKTVMAEWFAANPKAVERWGHWYVLCSELWDWFCERDWILKEWLPGWLLNQDLAQVQWPRPLIFDLGAQITQVEGQLIDQLSRALDITVIYPEAEWLALMPDTLRPYEPLLQIPFKGRADWQPQPSEALSFGRFTTQLAEVKDAVARVREWLDAGVAPDKIAIVAGDIEAYWPALRLYFEREGVPVNKPVTMKIGGFLEMNRWLSSMRTALGRLKTPDLEMALFGMTEKPRLPVAEFRRLFTHIYGEDDLARAERLFENKEAPKAESSLKDFLVWSLSQWPAGGDVERLEGLLGVVGQEVPTGLKLPPGEWLNFFEGLLARREETLSKGTEGGVWCVSLSSAHWLPVTHGLFLNLNEGALRSVERSPVSVSDAQMVLQDTGFALGSSERQQLEFELIWFWQRPWQQLRLTFSAHDFQGAVLTPSRLWMWSAFANDQFKKHPEAPRTTRWDEIQRGPEVASEGLKTGLKRDRDGQLSTWSRKPQDNFSSSRLERYWECPFLFAVQKRLRLSDEPALDLDLDRRTRGRLLHSILEKLTLEPMRFDWSDEELSAVIQQCREEVDVVIADERLWPALMTQHLRIARAFLAYEKDWRAKFPNTKTVGRELEVKGYWDLGSGGPTKTETPTQFFGRLDRVDQDSKGRYAVLDYKASAAGNRNWQSWLDNTSMQLPFYSMLVEEGMTELPPGEVVAANYYVVKDADRGKGFYVKDDSAELYELGSRSRSAIAPEKKAELIHDMKKQITSALEGIQEGRLNPSPRDLKTCTTCSWRRQCRSPHLN
jgi:RecB family exonuclease